MAQDTILFVERVVGGPARFLGYSDGACVGLLVAQRRPDLVSRLAFVAGVFHYEGWLPGVIDPANQPPAFMAEGYAEVSPDGPAHFPIVVDKLAQMHLDQPALTAAHLAGIKSRTLIMLGDDDEVSLEHAVALYRGLPNAELAVVPGTSHGLLVEKPALCHAIVLDFLCEEPVSTFAPIRRASLGG
jgi:pimeloyl-ACP methyl ester carboxylesterase